MAEIRVDVRKVLHAPSGVVYRCLADFTYAHPRLLPHTVRDYDVAAGGFGEGTIVACVAQVRGHEHHFSFRVSEPIAGKVLTIYDHDARFTITWHLRDEGESTTVSVEAEWINDRPPIGLVGAWWAQLWLRRDLQHMLDRLPEVIADRQFELPDPPPAPE
jgi:Polyketide cyclase / dehydrase and lipid transport